MQAKILLVYKCAASSTKEKRLSGVQGVLHTVLKARVSNEN